MTDKNLQIMAIQKLTEIFEFLKFVSLSERIFYFFYFYQLKGSYPSPTGPIGGHLGVSPTTDTQRLQLVEAVR